ncbi:class I adenylate-forming enzyme family protein [Nocardioides nitrophenolicus]|uniref:class I adenylate-forming enzyme family protein n=1 Tax=Nocardioides nitrophenolicus TaxID=60489 RepID=UPI001956A3CD|nr:AMP-binding protein [Nocardioides nitrophenolicus]MBM7517943.1 acyl-CoA synthetase (AMP-forming)/AMP-acid ligase II [Nocardioides nitrophenolicus]
MAAPLAELWFERARTHADAPAVDDGRVRLTWGELLPRAVAVSERLASAGMAPGDVVVLQARNTVDWVLLAGGTHLGGGVLAPLGAEEPVAARREYAARVGARLVVAESPAAGELDLGRVCDRLASGDRRELAARAAHPVGEPAGPAVLLATSGTAGHRRTVAMDHAVLHRLYADVAAVLDIDQHDRLLGVVPLAHSFGFNGLLVQAVLTGASLRLVPDRGGESLARIVRESGATVVAGPPALLHDLAAAVRAGAELGPRVRLFMTGATEIRPDELLPLAATAGIPRVSAGYGLTQTCGTVAICPDLGRLAHGRHAPMTPLPGVEVSVVDAVGTPVAAGTAGRVLTRGYQVAVATGAGGWLTTGDEGHLHRDGRLCVTGRLDDQLVVSGFNVDPVRVERALGRSPYVAQVAVIGLPDPRRGHRLVAVAVPLPGVDADGRNDAAVLAEARAVLAGYEVPDAVVWMDALPHTATGKLSRAAVRALLAAHLADSDQEDDG